MAIGQQSEKQGDEKEKQYILMKYWDEHVFAHFFFLLASYCYSSIIDVYVFDLGCVTSINPYCMCL